MVVDADRALEAALAEDPALAAEWEASGSLSMIRGSPESVGSSQVQP